MISVINRQKNLFHYKNYYKGPIDGIAGKMTKEAYTLFQKDNGLVVDRIYGVNTENKLLEKIRDLQTKLNSHGSTLVVDGLVGDKTIEAIKQFQSNNGLVVDGIAGIKTLTKLDEAKTEEIYRYPVNFIGITNYFNSSHQAIDLGWNAEYGGKNVPIYACGSGEIITNSFRNDRGNYIEIKHSNGDISRYCHLEKKSDKSVSTLVKLGEEIGRMGNTGESRGNHLHFGLMRNNKNIDPVEYVYVYPEQTVNSLNRDMVKYL